MSMTINRQLPLPSELKAEYPLSPGVKALKAARDREIREVFEGESHKFLVIVGPCSADLEDAVLDYVTKLAGIQERVKEKLVLINLGKTFLPEGAVPQLEHQAGNDAAGIARAVQEART